jgi:uncharacterized protein YecT (DUF1311 family)
MKHALVPSRMRRPKRKWLFKKSIVDLKNSLCECERPLTVTWPCSNFVTGQLFRMTLVNTRRFSTGWARMALLFAMSTSAWAQLDAPPPVAPPIIPAGISSADLYSMYGRAADSRPPIVAKETPPLWRTACITLAPNETETVCLAAVYVQAATDLQTLYDRLQAQSKKEDGASNFGLQNDQRTWRSHLVQCEVLNGPTAAWRCRLEMTQNRGAVLEDVLTTGH